MHTAIKPIFNQIYDFLVDEFSDEFVTIQKGLSFNYTDPNLLPAMSLGWAGTTPTDQELSDRWEYAVSYTLIVTNVSQDVNSPREMFNDAGDASGDLAVKVCDALFKNQSRFAVVDPSFQVADPSLVISTSVLPVNPQVPQMVTYQLNLTLTIYEGV